MRERILLVPGANATELVKTLARFGVNTFNFRAVNAAGLAELALQRSGISVPERILTLQESASLIASLLPQLGDYWKNSGYADAQQLAATLQTARLQITGDERETLRDALRQSEFTEKCTALQAVFDAYASACTQQRLSDAVMLLRLAIAQAEPLRNAELILLTEYPCTPLERALAEHLAGQPCEPVSLLSLFGRTEQPLRIGSYTAAYAASNEVADVIRTVCAENLPLDSCTVAVTDTRQYAQLIYELCRQLELDVTFGCGIPISNSNPAAFLKALDHWSTAGFFGKDALTALVNGSFFDRGRLQEMLGVDRSTIERVLEHAGELRLSYDAAANTEHLRRYEEAYPAQSDEDRLLTEALHRLAAELQKGPAYLLQTYTRLRGADTVRNLDRSALSVLLQAINSYLAFAPEGQPDLSPIIPQLMDRTVCAEQSRPGALHVTRAENCSCSLRENLFVTGLSADKFPGRPTENYLLLDNEMALLGEDAPISQRAVSRRSEQLEESLLLASSLGCRIRLSYSEINAAELKNANFSSVMFDLYRREHGEAAPIEDFTARLRRVGYFEQSLFADDGVGQAYKEGKRLITQPDGDADMPSPVRKRADFSPTAIETFFSCPKHFYLKTVIGLREPEEDDPFTVIDAGHYGDLAHEMMEYYSEHPELSEEAFLAEGRRRFAQYLAKRPALHRVDAESELQSFSDMLSLSYTHARSEHGEQPEEELSAVHAPTQIGLHGRIDRLEQNEDGTYTVVDYKSKRKEAHVQDDVKSCIQAMLYAYMEEASGEKTVSGCEYRYLRLGTTVRCAYNDETKAKLDELMQELRTALDSGVFPATPGDDACKYCRFGTICGKQEREGEA